MKLTTYERKAIGKRFRMFRKRNWLTQEEMAPMVGVTRPHLSRIENGKNSPQRSTMRLFCLLEAKESDF